MRVIAYLDGDGRLTCAANCTDETTNTAVMTALRVDKVALTDNCDGCGVDMATVVARSARVGRPVRVTMLALAGAA